MFLSNVWAFLVDHQTTIAISMGWLFSAICSAQPPLAENSGYYKTWAHNIIQTIAANPAKLRLPAVKNPEQ